MILRCNKNFTHPLFSIMIYKVGHGLAYLTLQDLAPQLKQMRNISYESSWDLGIKPTLNISFLSRLQWTCAHLATETEAMEFRCWNRKTFTTTTPKQTKKQLNRSFCMLVLLYIRQILECLNFQYETEPSFFNITKLRSNYLLPSAGLTPGPFKGSCLLVPEKSKTKWVHFGF